MQNYDQDPDPGNCMGMDSNELKAMLDKRVRGYNAAEGEKKADPYGLATKPTATPVEPAKPTEEQVLRFFGPASKTADVLPFAKKRPEEYQRLRRFAVARGLLAR